jgi:hypothetical protein
VNASGIQQPVDVLLFPLSGIADKHRPGNIQFDL